MINSIKNFLKFYFRATTLYNVHSPFVYEFVDFIFRNKLNEDFEKQIKIERNALDNSSQEIEVLDLGAGSKSTKISKTDKVSRIAKTAVSGKLKSLWLHNICAYFKPDFLIEMGTSLGISTAHLAQNASKVTSLEGNPAIASQAQKVFKNLELKNIEIVTGNFDETLLECLEKNELPDMVYLDGNHTYDATLRYFNQLNSSRNEHEMVLIFDDIYWSDGMMQAWEEIKKHPDISLSIDIYYFGLIFFKTNTVAPKHYTLVLSNWKLWHIGFRPVKHG